MRTISYKIGDLERVVIGIGYVGENEHTGVRIDCTEVFDQYPNAQAGMVIKPPVGDPYPKTVMIEGNTVVWDVTDSDLATEGSGEMQLNFTENNVIVKSCVSKIRITRSIVGNGTAPEPLQDWLTQAVETLEEADQAIEAATEAAATAEAAAEDLEALDDITKAAQAGDVGKALSPKTVENGVVTEWQFVEPGAGTDDYADLDNKPSIAGVTLSGNKSLEDLGIAAADDVDNLADDVSDVKNAIEGVSDDVDDLFDHETYEGGGEPTIEYEPVTENSHVSDARTQINAYGIAAISTPASSTVRIYPVEIGKTYKVVGRCVNTNERPLLIVADNVASSAQIATAGNFDFVLGSSSTAGVEEKEYTALRTGYMYITATNSDCGVWLKKTITPSEKKYHIDDVLKDVSNIKGNVGLLNNAVLRTKVDSNNAVVKNVPRNADSIAKVKSVADSVTLVRSIISRNLADITTVGDVVVDAEGTEKKGFKTVHLPAGNYYIILGNVGNYTMVKKVEHGVYTTLYKDQFPMKIVITDPGGGYFIVYASSIANLGDLSGVMIGLLMENENTLSFEAYAERTYTPEAIEADNQIEVRPYGLIEFVTANGESVASTVEYTVIGKDDDTTTRKDFITSPDGSKFLPMVKDDGTISCARVVPKKALFIGNSLTSGWQTFGEAATDSDHDFVAFFSSVVGDMESSYTFNRKWSTGFEQQTSLANAQSWVTSNIDPMLSDDLDLIVVQLCENVVDNASAVATFPESSLWLMKHLRTECPKARVVWMGLWFERRWTKTLLENTAKAGVEYIDIRPLYKQENVSVIGSIYKMDSDYAKSYDVDSFTVDNGQITLVFTVDGVEYTSTIPSYTSYTSSGDTQITVTGIYHVVNTWYAYMHPGNEGFRKIANKMLFDLGISDSEETIPADA